MTTGENLFRDTKNYGDFLKKHNQIIFGALLVNLQIFRTFLLPYALIRDKLTNLIEWKENL